jgi:hypothetical protein
MRQIQRNHDLRNLGGELLDSLLDLRDTLDKHFGSLTLSILQCLPQGQLLLD